MISPISNENEFFVFVLLGRRRSTMRKIKIGPGGVCKVDFNFNTSNPFQHSK